MHRVVILAPGIGLYVYSFQSSSFSVQFISHLVYQILAGYFRPLCILWTPLMLFVSFPFSNKICIPSAVPSCVLRVSETCLSLRRHLKYIKTGSRVVKLCSDAVLFMCIGPNLRPDHFVFRHLTYV